MMENYAGWRGGAGRGGRERFGTRIEGHQLAKRSWVCAKCGIKHPVKTKKCSSCRNDVIYYFASKKETFRYFELKLMESAGYISNLKMQQVYDLSVCGHSIAKYRADFVYSDSSGNMVVEDVKGSNNSKGIDPVFKIKKKLFKAIHGIDIQMA